MEKLDLNEEVERLLVVRSAVDGEGLPHPNEIPIMIRDTKIDILADGVIAGWYGDWRTRKMILKDLYTEVQDRVTTKLKENRRKAK